MDRTRITVLDMQPIDPPVGGGRLRLMGLYSGMSDDVDVTYVGSFDWRGPEYREIRLSDNLTEIDVPLSEAHFAAHDALAKKLGKGCIDSAFPLQGQLSVDLINRACVEAKKADAVIFSHPWLFPFVAPELEPERQLVVYDSQNCEGKLKEQLLDNGSAAARRVCEAVIRSEYELCRAADLILACSEEDKAAFIELYGVVPDKILLVPNGVFTSRVLPPEAAEKAKLKEKLDISSQAVCFIGSEYDPNYEAAQLILEVAEILPRYQFVILGGVGERLKREKVPHSPNVRITGFLEEDEKTDYLRACDLALNPMLSGSGTNIKMFDFMAAGLPIAATDIGARGIENTNGRVYQLCGHEAAEIAEAVDGLLQNPERLAFLGMGGRREAELRYSWETISRHLGETVKREYLRKKNRKEKVLMVSTYPPERCGIGRYAQQQAAFLRNQGARVDILAIRGNGDAHCAFTSVEDILSLRDYKTRYDRIIIQYHASFFYAGCETVERIRRHKAFAKVLADNPNIELVCHEITFPAEDEELGISAEEAAFEMLSVRDKWLSAGHILFHTEKEKNLFCEKLGLSEDDGRLELVPPNKYYVPECSLTKAEARQQLDIPENACVFLCIGFIQPHKAFDEAAAAFSKLQDPDKRLYIVGSLRYVTDDTLAYLEKLQAFSGKNNVTVIDSFVSDEAFDAWIIACDCVLVPYREIWSSGVLGRAKMLGKPCIVRNAGGLAEQLGSGDILFEEYEELPDILKNFDPRKA